MCARFNISNITEKISRTIDNKLVVGSEQWCSFSGFSIPVIKARVNSGAKTSTIHAFNIQSFNRNGQAWVSFEVHPIQNDSKITTHYENPIVDRRYVKSSNGNREKRFVISEPVLIGGDIWEMKLTLTNRDIMGYRMLLGREAKSGRMLVDPADNLLLGELTNSEISQLYDILDQAPQCLK